jgi:hypothetical protein
MRRANGRRGIAATVIGLAALGTLAAVPSTDVDLWEPTVGGWVSGPVEYVGTAHEEVGTAIDAVVHGHHLYVTSWRSFSIYDVSTPEDPRHLTTEPLAAPLLNEHPQTDGEILLLSHDQRPEGTLAVWDVTDPEDPTHVTDFHPSTRQHLFACVLDCAYAYGSHGAIIDLADPAAPVEVGAWTDVAPAGSFHAIDEVAPGVVVTGSEPSYVLDARDDPTTPEVLAVFEPDLDGPPAFRVVDGGALVGRADWPHVAPGRSGVNRPDRELPTKGDRFALATIETPFTGDCEERSGAFVTFDTHGWEETGEFTLADEHRITSTGIYADGEPPTNVVGCSPFVFDAHPDYGPEGRLAAVAWFEHGVRLLDVDDEGTITEVGGFLGHAGNAATALWVTDEVLYLIDLHRGIDVLRVAP